MRGVLRLVLRRQRDDFLNRLLGYLWVAPGSRCIPFYTGQTMLAITAAPSPRFLSANGKLLCDGFIRFSLRSQKDNS